jgi:DNA ligase D-like protein (predicted 3'-phosphoesterase)
MVKQSATKKLAAYQAKRDFSKTNEPSGKAKAAPTGRLRFVIQKHDATRLHYDLRLELDGVFKSWAVTRGPSLDPHDKRLAVEVEDHPLDYGDFEGTIPKGQYGGGTVQLWDRGFWEVEGPLLPEAALRKGDLKFRLEGQRLKGSWVLVRMRSDKFKGKRENWLPIKHRDDFARDGDGPVGANFRHGNGRSKRADSSTQRSHACDIAPGGLRTLARSRGKPARRAQPLSCGAYDPRAAPTPPSVIYSAHSRKVSQIFRGS